MDQKQVGGPPSSDDGPAVSIVVPTYQEVDSLPHLLERIGAVRDSLGVPVEVFIMDDDSQDGTVERIAELGLEWVTLVVRTQDRGLSNAVLEGLYLAKGRTLVVMDADLSHSPETLPAMLTALDGGADFVIGSRYVAGGGTSHDWGVLRYINSLVATLLARPFTTAKDPMSGFFALRRDTFEAGRGYEPIGYKIGLELLVKCGCVRVEEVPIHFEDRKYGESKLTLAEQLRYIQHIRRLAIHKYGVWSNLAQFLVVGAIGTVVNLAALTLLIALGLPSASAVAAAIFISMCSNFVLNRRFSFGYARHEPVLRQFIGFIGASSVGGAVIYGVTLGVLSTVPDLAPQIAALFGIAGGMGLNFLLNRYFVFKMKHYRPGTSEPPASGES